MQDLPKPYIYLVFGYFGPFGRVVLQAIGPPSPPEWRWAIIGQVGSLPTDVTEQDALMLIVVFRFVNMRNGAGSQYLARWDYTQCKHHKDRMRENRAGDLVFELALF